MLLASLIGPLIPRPGRLDPLRSPALARAQRAAAQRAPPLAYADAVADPDRRPRGRNKISAARFNAGAAGLSIGTLQEAVGGSFGYSIYVTAASYTSAAYGNVCTTDEPRTLSGLEVLVGLLMIA